ncbi:MAG: PaaI family thioesterase [Burkholderiaceae bacterium]
MAEQASYHPFADLIGLAFTHHGPADSVCAVTLREALLNPHHVVHGGVIYSMADTGQGAALYPSLADGEICATIEIKVSYFRAVSAGTLECRSRIVHRGRRTAHAESEIFEGGRLVAKASGSWAIFSPSADAVAARGVRGASG